MGFVTDLVTKESDDEYAELSEKDLANQADNQSVAFVDVTSQDDVVNAKESLHDGLILILDVAYIESNGLSLKAVYGELEQTVDSINGDIVHKKGNDILLATPRNVSIRREKL